MQMKSIVKGKLVSIEQILPLKKGISSA